MPLAAANLPLMTIPSPLHANPKVSGWKTVPSVKPGAASPLRMTTVLPDGPIHMTAELFCVTPAAVTTPVPVSDALTSALPSLLTYCGLPADTDMTTPVPTGYASPPR